jgi:hypothetical protein
MSTISTEYRQWRNRLYRQRKAAQRGIGNAPKSDRPLAKDSGFKKGDLVWLIDKRNKDIKKHAGVIEEILITKILVKYEGIDGAQWFGKYYPEKLEKRDE